jgi:hypothetical protein
LEDRFGNQHLAAVYHSQLKTRVQGDGDGKSWQEFATTIKQLAYHACSALPEDHIRRDAGKAFADRVEDYPSSPRPTGHPLMTLRA